MTDRFRLVLGILAVGLLIAGFAVGRPAGAPLLVLAVLTATAGAAASLLGGGRSRRGE